jgi:hypothetical protein
MGNLSRRGQLSRQVFARVEWLALLDATVIANKLFLSVAGHLANKGRCQSKQITPMVEEGSQHFRSSRLIRRLSRAWPGFISQAGRAELAEKKSNIRSGVSWVLEAFF